MSRTKPTDADLAARTALLGTALLLCCRDDATVAQQIHQSKTADEVEVLDKVAFFDEFFAFLRRLGVMSLLEGLDPGLRLGASIPWIAMVGVYAMRLLVGLASIPQTEGLVLTDPALMGLCGLAAFVIKGISQRGVSRAHRLPKVRGALSGEAMVDALVKVSPLTIACVFNAVIRILAKLGYFPKVVHAVVDCTDLETTPKYRMLPWWQEGPAQAGQAAMQPRCRPRSGVGRCG